MHYEYRYTKIDNNDGRFVAPPGDGWLLNAVDLANLRAAWLRVADAQTLKDATRDAIYALAQVLDVEENARRTAMRGHPDALKEILEQLASARDLVRKASLNLEAAWRRPHAEPRERFDPEKRQ